MLPAVESDISRHLFIQSLKGLVENSDPDDPGIGLLLIDIKGFRRLIAYLELIKVTKY